MDTKSVELDKDFEEILVYGDQNELNELKSWLFSENIRLQSERNELTKTQQKFVGERKQFQDEMKDLNQKIVIERKRLKEDNLFFEKKMEILKSGFSQLDLDRRKLDKEWKQLQMEREEVSRDILYRSKRKHSDVAELLFTGVKNPLSLKKRYKDLLKMFHPDNIAGDHDMVLMINKLYEELKADYEIGRQA